MSATFFIVPTPIGNLEDITLRALDVLKKVDFIAAEDTRHSRYLLDHYNINTPCFSLFQHNEKQRTAAILAKLQAGQSGALISDAGTPLISDPGYHLLAELQAANIRVVPLPGACALITALSAAGVSPEQFYFGGFLPTKTSQRCQIFQPLLESSTTSVFYEAPHRLLRCLEDIQTVLGPEREIAVARELTKQYEQFYRGPVSDILATFQTHPDQCRGELVIMISGITHQPAIDAKVIEMLTLLSNEMPRSKAVVLVAKITGVNKNQLYALAVKGEE